MIWLRKYPAFIGACLALGLALAVEVAGLARGWRLARAAQKQLEQVSREARSLQTLRPAATAENAGQIAADCARATDTLVALRAEITPHGALADRFNHPATPVRRADAFFDLATFVEAMRGRAQQAGVGLLPDERFGFSAYANDAPASEQLAAVFRQRLIVQYLVEALLDAKPHQLLSVQRQRPMEAVASAGGPNPGTGPGATGRLPNAAARDYFEIDPRISLRAPGVVATTAFRLIFTGRTAALRSLLNKLAEFELPLIVRSVEVVPAEFPPGARTSERTGPPSLVAPLWSRFVVTVEFVEFGSPGKATS